MGFIGFIGSIGIVPLSCEGTATPETREGCVPAR
jgi:hypothetical protein